MKYSKKELETLTELGSKFFSYTQCAIALDKDISEFSKDMRMQHTEAFKAYQKGFITSELELRDGILELAKRGSSPAQAQMLKIIERTIGENS